MRESPETHLATARKPEKLPDYFTPEEAAALVAAAPSYQVRTAMRIMIHARLRVSECLFLRPMDIWLDRAPSSTCRRAELQGHKAPTDVTINIIGMAEAGALYLPYLGSVCGILTRDLRVERAVSWK